MAKVTPAGGTNANPPVATWTVHGALVLYGIYGEFHWIVSVMVRPTLLMLTTAMSAYGSLPSCDGKVSSGAVADGDFS